MEIKKDYFKNYIIVAQRDNSELSLYNQDHKFASLIWEDDNTLTILILDESYTSKVFFLLSISGRTYTIEYDSEDTGKAFIIDHYYTCKDFKHADLQVLYKQINVMITKIQNNQLF